MVVTCVYVNVKPEHVEEFIEATLSHHRATILEYDNLRFDVLQDANDPNRFILYTGFVSEQALELHQTHEHFLNWRETVEPWMAEPRSRVQYKVIAPEHRQQW